MAKGHVIADDTPAAIRAQVGGSTVRCRTTLTDANLMALPAVRRVEHAGAERVVQSGNAVATIRTRVGADSDLADLRISVASLEDTLSVLLQAATGITA